MKTLKMFGKLALAVLVCTGFVACSSDDDETTNPNGGVIGGKKITMLVHEQKGLTLTFDYDSEGKLVMASNTDPLNDLKFEYTWSDDAIDYTINGRKHRSYVLKNNLVQKDMANDGSDYFYYNSARQLKKWSPDGDAISLKWDGDKLTSVTSYDEDNSLEYKQTITYNGCCNAGYNPLIVNIVCDDEITYAHPELFGLRSTQLPSSITTESDEIWIETGTRNYEYEFDEAGYITKIVGKVESEIVETWTITWE